MALSRGVNVAVTGAGSANTDLGDRHGDQHRRLRRSNGVSARRGRERSDRGAAGIHRRWAMAPPIPDNGVLCGTSGTGTWFVENSAGNMTGDVFGRDTTG